MKMRWTRRDVIKAGVACAGLVTARCGDSFASPALPGPPAANEAFRERGYYVTFMRGPLFTFETWKRIFDDVKSDGGNMVILWMAGAFRSRKFPITWRYNAEHENVKHNFAGALIDYGHSLGLKTLLCLTPFAYDGTNQYPLEHPELKGLSHDGNFTKISGLDAWGYNLNPWRPESQQFMLEYTREMLEFYPNADGLLLESSDYAVSFCGGECSETYYQREFAFVRKISEELWARQPHATIAVYPHYFNGAEVPGLHVKAAREAFDPRWTLFFTPHSTQIDPELIRRAKSSLYWDPSPSFGRPALIRAAAQQARSAGFSGFVPSFEPWNFVYSGPDMGARTLIGKRSNPFGFGWLRPGELPSRTLLMRMDRLAYREFSQHPDLSMQDFERTLSQEIFNNSASDELLADLLFVDESFFLDRTWDSTAAIASPEYVLERVEQGQLGPAKLRDYQERRQRIAQIAAKYEHASDAPTRELGQISRWITTEWNASPSTAVLAEHLR